MHEEPNNQQSSETRSSSERTTCDRKRGGLSASLFFSAIIHGGLLATAVAYSPQVIEAEPLAPATEATFEEVVIPEDLLADLLGQEGEGGDPEIDEAPVEDEPAAPAPPAPEPVDPPEPEVTEAPPEPEPEVAPPAPAPEPEVEPLVEPTPNEDIAAVTPPPVDAEAPDDEEEAAPADFTNRQPVANAGSTGAASPNGRPGGTGDADSTGTSTRVRAAAATGGGDGLDRGLLDAHRRRLSRAMNGDNHCPREAIRQRLNGIAYVGIRQDSRGRVVDVKLRRSAGLDLLDQEAVALVERMRRLPAPPDEIRGTEFIVPVQFRCG